MPNWVRSELNIVGDKEDIRKLMDKCHSVDENGEENFFDFNGLIPTPNNIYQGNLGAEELATYGENNWYDWNRKNWGTKWNSFNTNYGETRDGMIVFFDTAWNAPFPIYRAIKEQYPNLSIVAFWADEDLGNNCGWYDNGDIVYVDIDKPTDPVNFACTVWGYDADEMKEEYGIA